MKILLFGRELQVIPRAGRIMCKTGRTVSGFAILILVVIGGASAWLLTGNRPAAPGLETCGYSNQVYDGDASLMQQKPTHFRLMTSRYVEIVQAARGYHCTGRASVAFNGHNYIQSGMFDDPGIAELIPTISSLTGISLAATFDLTVFAVISLGVLVGYAGFWRLYPDERLLWVGIGTFLCLGLAEAMVADVYIFQISPLIAGIPWILYFGLSGKPFALNVSAALLAFCCSWCSLVRSGTTLICMTFIIAVFVGRFRVQKIFLPLLLVILACLPSMIFERRVIARRDAVLASLGETATVVNSHPLWHSIYIGLAFIHNSEVPEYNDAVAMDKAQSIDPMVRYGSAKYEGILRSEVLNLAKRRPMLLIENLAAKAGIVILLGSILLFPSRRFLFAERTLLWVDAAFVLSIGLSAMNAILVIPRPRYLLTFLCLTLLYSSVKICRALSIHRHSIPTAFGRDSAAVRLSAWGEDSSCWGGCCQGKNANGPRPTAGRENGYD